MVDFTIAIPTYNGEHRLADVFDALRMQVGLDDVSWDILVVDNNSHDQTAAVVRQFQATSPVPVRYALERRQGAAYARDRALHESMSELIGFLDDDNIPAPDWIAAAYRFALNHPKAGAIASRIYADYEIEPPSHFNRIAPFLAITQRGNKPLQYLPHQRILPPSAGLVVRRQTWFESVPETRVLSGRANGNMLTGEDLEMLAHIQRSGWEIWYNPEMTLTHKIPRHRLQPEYLLPFFRGIGFSRHVTRMLNIAPWKRPLYTLAHACNDLRKIIRHLCKYRFQIKTDVVAACELQLFISSLWSPVYLWRQGYLSRRSSRQRSRSSLSNANASQG